MNLAEFIFNIILMMKCYIIIILILVFYRIIKKYTWFKQFNKKVTFLLNCLNRIRLFRFIFNELRFILNFIVVVCSVFYQKIKKYKKKDK